MRKLSDPGLSVPRTENLQDIFAMQYKGLSA